VRQLWPSKIPAGGGELLYVATGAPLGLIWSVVLLGCLAAGLGSALFTLGIPLLVGSG
jgi:hypothetical protein